jgi:iron complex transport system ATP-binding protein
VLAAIHDLSLAARFADRIIVLSRGRIVAEGPPVRVLSGALLRSVWGVAAEVRTDPRSGIPYLLPRLAPDPSTDPSSAAGWGPVHVLGGGGAAAPWMRTLVDAGYRVTAGALHLLDTDAETAESLGIETTLEIPFAPLGDEVRARHRGQITAARALVVTPFATGPSNLGNLEDLAAVTPGTPVYLVGTESPETLDFTGGRATRLRTALAIQGAELIPDAPTLLRRLGERRRGHPGPSALPDAPASLGSR